MFGQSFTWWSFNAIIIFVINVATQKLDGFEDYGE